MAKKEVSTTDMQVGQVSDIILQDGSVARGGLTIDPVESVNKEWLDEIAFMEEEIRVMVNETTDKNAENPVIVGNNGIFKAFPRGQVITAKRKFVDCLIVKSGDVTTPKVKNGAGEDTFAIRQHSAHKYPFIVLGDSEKGVEWLQRRMSEAI